MKNTRLLLISLCLCLGTIVITTAHAQTRPIALVGGTLIDGVSDTPIRNSVVLIRGDRIEQVGTIDSLLVPEDYQYISTEGMTVLPGLWDLHVHLLYNGHPDFGHWFSTYADRFGKDTIPASAEQLLMAGVTSVRDLAVTTDDILAVRRRIEKGEIPGPTIYTAGAALMPGDRPFGPHILTISGAEDAKAKTRMLIEAGVDVIKFLGAGGRPVEEIKAIVDEAHAAGLKTTAHGRTDEEIRVGLAAGVDELQHIGTSSPEYPADIIATIRERVRTGPPLYWSPTVSPQLNADELAEDAEFLEDPRNFIGVPQDIVDDVLKAIKNHDLNPPPAETETIVRRKIEQLLELGVVLISGSDLGTFGLPAAEATWRDVDVWVRELNMDPMTAIRWTTADAAEFMGVGNDTGTITAGKYADIIAVRGNPLHHFDVLRDPIIVIKHGKQYK